MDDKDEENEDGDKGRRIRERERTIKGRGKVFGRVSEG